jgi:hypothetical protein
MIKKLKAALYVHAKTLIYLAYLAALFIVILIFRGSL